MASIPVAFIAWVLYFFGYLSTGLGLVVLLFISTIALKRVWTGLHRSAAANNAAFAAATFQTLDFSNQTTVETHALRIMERFGRSSLEGEDFLQHHARWGWYAIAMMELGIPPLDGLPKWNIVRDPLIALTPNDPYLVSTISRMKNLGYPIDKSLFED